MAGRAKLKPALWAGCGIILVAGIATFLLLRNLDGLVRKGIESYGTDAAGTAVRVADVHIALSQGRGTLRGLTVANPPGFSTSPLFALDDIDITLDAASLTGQVPIIEELHIGATAFRYEIDPRGQSNLSVVQRHLRKTAAKPGGTAQTKTERRYRIKRLVIADGEATLALGTLGVGSATARVPGLSLNDLGGNEGLTAEQLSATILAVLIKNLEKSVAAAGIERLLHGKGDIPAGEILKGLIGR